MKTLRERFEEKYIPEPNTGCWLWVGSYVHNGYGKLSFDGKTLRAHRIAFGLFRSAVPEAAMVLHTCDVRCCVNPDHLYLGTAKENSADMKRRGRQKKGEEHYAAKLTRNDVEEIRESDDPQWVLAERYGVSPSHISGIKGGRFWI